MRLLRAVVCSWSVAFFAVPAVAFAQSDTRLVDAIRARDLARVKALVRERALVNAPQGDGATPLHWAAHVDDLSIADALIRAGAKANAANENGFTPLHLACINRSGGMVERLLAAGADANAASLNGETVLMTCARSGDARAVRALLLKGARVNVAESSHNQTPLMWAVAQSHPEVTRQLIEAGADINARSRTYAQTVVGEQTQRFGREELNYIVHRGGSTPLLFAARSGDAESAKALLAAGANANDALAEGMSALVVAAHSGHTGVALTLLESGADPNAMGAGYAALHAAVLRSDLTLVKALLAKGADANVRLARGTPIRRDTTDFNLPATLVGATPYLLAAKFLEPDIMRALAAGGADIRASMRDGATALMVAAGAGSPRNANRRGIAVIDGAVVESEEQVLAAVETAIELGADLAGSNQQGDTALHVAATSGMNAIVRLLAERGAPINMKNKRGLTPLGALTSAGRPGARRRGAAITQAAIVDDDPEPAEREVAFPETIALLKELGAE